MIFCKPIAAAVLLFAALFAPFSAASGQEINLHGDHAVMVHGDDHAFADPAFDDSAWPRIPVPSSLRAAGVDGRPDVFWYRISFRVPSDWASTAPAIRLGIITRADETYLNGVRIGGLGIVGPAQSDWHAYAPTLPRLYPFHPSLLRVGERNVLAIRGAREPYIDDGGLIAGPVALVGLPVGLEKYLALHSRFSILQGILFGIETIVLFILVTCFFIGVHSHLLKLLLLFYTLYYVYALEYRGIISILGHDSQLLQFAANISGALTMPVLLEIVAHIFKRPLGFIGRGMQVMLVLALISIPNTGIGVLNWWAVESNLVWHGLLFFALLLIAVWSVQAAWQGKLHSWSILTGLSLLATGLVVDLLSPLNYFEQWIGVRIAEIGIMLFFLSIVFIVLRSLLEREHRLMQANANIARLHEQDRVRMAYNIHDGIVQWLGIIKIKLDIMLKSSHDDKQSHTPQIDSLVDDVEQVIADSRRLSEDLSPGLLEEYGLAGAMKSNVDNLRSIIDIRLVVDLPESIGLTDVNQTHVYRIFQEALSNAVRHSGGEEILVDVSQVNGRFHLRISDDGTGPPATVLTRLKGTDSRLGLGMKSMVSRAEVMGGELEVRPRAGGGTIVALNIPTVEIS